MNGGSHVVQAVRGYGYNPIGVSKTTIKNWTLSLSSFGFKIVVNELSADKGSNPNLLPLKRFGY